jgi:hypothetical protein
MRQEDEELLLQVNESIADVYKLQKILENKMV